MFNHYGFGGFLIPAGIPTFIDGQAELYGEDFIKRDADATKLRGQYRRNGDDLGAAVLILEHDPCAGAERAELAGLGIKRGA